MMDLEAMAAWIFARFHRDLIRIEAQADYDVDSDGGDYQAWRAGALVLPENPDRDGFWDQIRRDSHPEPGQRGRTWRKVHLIGHDPEQPGALSPYEHFEFAWGFTHTADAGEQVKILQAPELLAHVGDFFVVDGEHVIASHYEHGRHVGAEVVTGSEAHALIAVAHLTWTAAVPFTAWWAARPELHRNQQAA